MTREALATLLDSEGRLLEAAWAYELAWCESSLSADGLLNLVAIYYSLCDPGQHMNAPAGSNIASIADVRAREILAHASAPCGVSTEFATWSLMFRAHVDGEHVPQEAFERLAISGSLFAEIVTAESRDQLSAPARALLDAGPQPITERIRVMMSYCGQ